MPAERLEEMRARLLELVPEGFEETHGDGVVELAAYVDAGRESRLREALGPVQATSVPDGWEHGWRAFHRPVVAGGVWLGPPWERPPAGAPAVVVDPGLAFGTGAHPTTRLCLELLATLPTAGVVDVGCGSGVLAVAARRLGFDPVIAVDVDPVAVETTRATAAANHVEIEAQVLDATTEPLPAAEILLANIALPVVEQTLAGAAAPLAIVSGYLVGERPAVPGWRQRSRRALDGWAADLLAR